MFKKFISILRAFSKERIRLKREERAKLEKKSRDYENARFRSLIRKAEVDCDLRLAQESLNESYEKLRLKRKIEEVITEAKVMSAINNSTDTKKE